MYAVFYDAPGFDSPIESRKVFTLNLLIKSQ